MVAVSLPFTRIPCREPETVPAALIEMAAPLEWVLKTWTPSPVPSAALPRTLPVVVTLIRPRVPPVTWTPWPPRPVTVPACTMIEFLCAALT